MKKIVIIGANEFQNPLILKAREMGLETHVFAWREGAVGEESADYFYPVSITEKGRILEECRRIRPSGVATIGSDLAMVTVQYVASRLHLPCCAEECLHHSTNKYLMRQALERAGIRVPFYRCVDGDMDVAKDWGKDFPFPVIVKPTDRSGSRGVMKVHGYGELRDAVKRAAAVSFEKRVIVESFLQGSEYSFEAISQGGVHRRLAITKKYTTGSPNYIEAGHIEPSGLPEKICTSAENCIFRALDALGIRDGASHGEFKVDDQGLVHIIEIGARMGGDCIGSDLVFLSTGYDYVRMVIQASLGEPISFERAGRTGVAAVRFLFCREDLEHLRWIQREFPDRIVRIGGVGQGFSREVEDSGSRHGYYILKCHSIEEAQRLAELGDPAEML